MHDPLHERDRLRAAHLHSTHRVTLHHYGRHVTKSELLSEPGGPEEEYLSEEDEERTLAELARLAEELRKIDPAAFDGYIGFIWPELLDRCLF
ncbi:hypothetical protein [Streptomyces sp. NBC_00268]|uniref:hypothetical protein n=1 Tax=Streptomyces sp. NBC_00268 TaxID=2975695 RepID=UPI0022571D66|nr:hypothetical protein [Streptomyces sp. NBC_00268]MCX5191608.1 hypothetical protein [Streptomyces sp. NBC_00268]